MLTFSISTIHKIINVLIKESHITMHKLINYKIIKFKIKLIDFPFAFGFSNSFASNFIPFIIFMKSSYNCKSLPFIYIVNMESFSNFLYNVITNKQITVIYITASLNTAHYYTIFRLDNVSRLLHFNVCFTHFK